MASYVNFHGQMAAIMEVLANTAVAEICQLVDDGFATLRLEVSRSQRENLALKGRLRLMEVRSGEPIPPTCTRRDHFGEDGSAITKKVKFPMVENTDPQQSQLVVVTEQPVEPEVLIIKTERQEEELSVVEDHQTASNSSVGPLALALAAESDRPLSVEAETPRVSASGRYENQDLARPGAQQQEKNDERVDEASTRCRYSHPAEQSHGGGGPNTARQTTDLTKEDDKRCVDSMSAESSSSSKVPDIDTAPIKKLDSALSPTNTGGKGGLCGAAADWTGEEVFAAVKLEAEPSCSEAFRTYNPLVSVTGDESLSNSRLTNTTSLHTESEAAALDGSSLDDSSFDDLFSSPEVARSLTAPTIRFTNGITCTEEPLSTSSFPFPSSFRNSPMLDSPTVSSFANASSDSRRRSFSSSTERVFSCQHCGRLFSTSRDVAVHQRSHAGDRIYNCYLCKKPFVHPHQLKTHQRVHTGEKPFSCSQCGKRFSQSSHIKRHMSVHTGEKRYSCSLCGKRFSQACSLKVHQTVHTGERPYSCTNCGKSFSVLGNLVRHQSVHISK